MRIIAGKYGGQSLCVPKDVDFRPTTGLVKEAIFSMLNSLLNYDGLSVLELYAGSGALGFEALSRGARTITFVEKNAKLVQAIKSSAATLKIDPGFYNLLNLSVERAISSSVVVDKLKAMSIKGSYDLILCDPPYETHPGNSVIEHILRGELYSNGAIMIVESALRFVMDNEVVVPSGYATLFKEKKYGSTMLRFYQLKRIR